MDKRHKHLRRAASDKIDTFFINDLDMASRSIHLFDDVDDNSTAKVIKSLQVLIAANSEAPIDIFISSDGGDAYSGLFLYDYIRTLPTTIRTHACGKVFSAATLIYLAGDERFCYTNSVFMFHTVSTIVEGKSFDINSDGKECMALHRQICNIYAENSKISFSKWDKLIKHEDRYIRAKQALEFGICTGIKE